MLQLVPSHESNLPHPRRHGRTVVGGEHLAASVVEPASGRSAHGTSRSAAAASPLCCRRRNDQQQQTGQQLAQCCQYGPSKQTQSNHVYTKLHTLL